jgi:transposase-like protein
MTGKRQRYSADFGAKLALEALRGELTTAQLASKHGIHQTMVGEWKRQAVEGLAGCFPTVRRPRRRRGLPRPRLKSCTRRSVSCWWSEILWRKPLVDECRAKAADDRTPAPSAICGLEVDVAGEDHAPEVELFHACSLAAAIECQITIAH